MAARQSLHTASSDCSPTLSQNPVTLMRCTIDSAHSRHRFVRAVFWKFLNACRCWLGPCGSS
jgi:hypothetical protein